MKRSMVDTRRGLQKAVILFALGWGMASTGAEPAEQMSFADGLFSRGLYDMAATEYESLLGAGTGFEGEDGGWPCVVWTREDERQIVFYSNIGTDPQPVFDGSEFTGEMRSSSPMIESSCS